MGVKEKTRKASRGGLIFWFLFIGTVASLCITANAYFYMINQLLALPAWSSYHWEVLWEMCVIGSVFPVYDGSNLYALCVWLYTGSLNFVEHHVMNAAWVGSVTMAAILLFTAHDAHWFWPHPGLGMFARAAVQLLPQFAFLLPHFPRIFRYLLAAPSYKDASVSGADGIVAPLHGEADPDRMLH
uniref:Uncharacterized protein n=1 Tax=Chromera velia CCMP2878 TaxID=1169474 RepID=A0A0G4I2T0_9ALVE|eukprot:Cvel_35113.t1-p1 / transcript=Cvel_35113.t1 / gene=Cvel_35113 / organism=Chromera_velia_CCMP2878 / gene_product=hypothetical protein / transcript_product=hypothetical protein / location=Cvel_scaffold6289:1982-2533(-) / protein_length=184 / sequence_SO=supercontig / SO=protein_coding / is_pseudo=false